MEKLITGNDARRFAIFTIDLDKFKEINDLQGHLIGDQLLQRVAGAVLKTLQKEEMVARFGGDEFVAVKPFPMREVDAFAARLWHCFSGKQTFAATEVVLSASIGISVYPEDGTDINTILSNSDLAMYRAKSSLDHKICWYEREMDDKTRQRNMMAADIRRGIHAGEFSPTIRLSATSKIVASPVTRRCCAGSIRSWGRSRRTCLFPSPKRAAPSCP